MDCEVVESSVFAPTSNVDGVKPWAEHFRFCCGRRIVDAI